MNSVKNTFKNNIFCFLLFCLHSSTVSRNRCYYKYISQITKDSCIPTSSQYIVHKLLINIHESHYLRFARLYSFFHIIRMLTNHTFALTTPSWNRLLSYLIKSIKYFRVCQRNFNTFFHFFLRIMLLFTLRSNSNGFCRCFACRIGKIPLPLRYLTEFSVLKIPTMNYNRIISHQSYRFNSGKCQNKNPIFLIFPNTVSSGFR